MVDSAISALHTQEGQRKQECCQLSWSKMTVSSVPLYLITTPLFQVVILPWIEHIPNQVGIDEKGEKAAA